MPPEEAHCLLPVRHFAEQWRSADKITRTRSEGAQSTSAGGEHLARA